MRTLADLFYETTSRNRRPDYFWDLQGDRFQPLSTDLCRDRVLRLAQQFAEWQIRKGDRIALLSENRVDWTLTDFAILISGAVNVPLHVTSTPAQILYILRESRPRVLAVSGEEQFQKVRALQQELEAPEHLVSFDRVNDAPEVFCVQDLWGVSSTMNQEIDGRLEAIRRSLTGSDLASLIYTSGTTGEPKGVMLSHGNIISNVLTSSHMMPVGPNDLALAILPLSHIFERMVDFGYLCRGVPVAFCRRFDDALRDLRMLRPTVVACVPRLFEKIYAGLVEMAATAAWPRNMIASWAIELGRELGPQLGAGEELSWLQKILRALADRMVYSPVRKRLGSRIRFMMSGGAPLAQDLAEFFYVMKLLILQGYGLTETSPIISATDPENIRFGSCGRVIPGTEVRIAEDGEILVRGPNVMLGYFNKPEATREAMPDGWFRTGDVGYLDNDGFLYVTDRKKDLIVTSGGKKVAPQKIETLLAASRFIERIVIVGNGRKFVSALIVPNFAVLQQYARYKGIPFQDVKELLKHPRIEDLYLRQIRKYAPDLASYETVKKALLLSKPFSVEEGELTTSLKIRRTVVEKRYKAEIDALYRESG